MKLIILRNNSMNIRNWIDHLKNPYVVTLLSTASKIIVRVVSFIIIAPILGPFNQGTLVFNSALSAVIILLLVFGLPVRALKEISINTSQAINQFYNDLMVMLVLFWPTMVLGAVVFHYAGKTSESEVFYLLLLAAAASVVGDYCSAVLRATANFIEEAWVSIITGIFHVLLVVGVALLYRDLLIVCQAILISRILFCIIFVIRTRRKLLNTDGMSVWSHTVQLRKTFKQSTPYAFDAFLATVISNIDVLILEYIVSRESLGWYSAGSRFIGLFLVVPPLAQNVIIPILSRVQGTHEYLAKRNSIRFGFILFAVFCVCIVNIMGPFFTKHVLGSQFTSLDQLWIYFSVFLCARVYESYNGIVMYAGGLVKARILRLAFGIVAMIISGYWSARHFGLEGFIISLALCYCAIAISYPRVATKI